MKASSEKRIQQLHPALASALRGVLADLATRGIAVEVVQGLRTIAEQDELFAKGRTKPGPIVTQACGGESNHNYGLAADLCPFVNDAPDWNAPMPVWSAIGEAAAAHGLEWGGRWKKFLDKPHVQLPSITIRECASCYKAGGLEAVWSLASGRVNGTGAPLVRGRDASQTDVVWPRGLRGTEGGAMIRKRVTVILYGSDRNLWRGGALQIRVADLFAARGPQVLYQGRTEESTVELLLDLPFDAGQMYGLTFSAPRHRPAWQFVRRLDFIRTPEETESDDLILRLMLVPDSPGTGDLGRGFGRLQQIASPFVAPETGLDAASFASLDDAAKMAFLNVEGKLRETVIDGAPLISFVRAVEHVAVDRVFLLFDAALKARMPRAGAFAGAPGHGAPAAVPGLPAHPDSWKHTRFAEGNVQLSFSGEAAPLSRGGAAGLVHSADVDIDLGRGLAHAKEWLHNNVFRPGHKTNQALVYALLYAQGILPAYTLDAAPDTTLRSIPRLTMRGVPARRRSGRRAATSSKARPAARPAKKRAAGKPSTTRAPARPSTRRRH